MTGQQLTLEVMAEQVVAPSLAPSHRHDPSTSKRAALANLPRSGSQKARVLAALHAAGDYGATDYELGEAIGALRTAAGTRRKWLADHGLVRATPRERETDTPGSMAVVHVLTDQGYEVARKLAQVSE